MDDALRAELIALRDYDQRVRSQLIAEGTLFGGYNPRMEQVHRANAARLREVVARHGWPGRELVGDEATGAAFMIVQHSIGEPGFMREMLALMREAASRGDLDPVPVAMLEDRIRDFEGRRQLYGTQFDWDEQGLMSPKPIEDEAGVDARRAAVGMPPLSEAIAQMRTRVAEADERPPADRAEYVRGYEEWLRKVGWRGEEPGKGVGGQEKQ